MSELHTFIFEGLPVRGVIVRLTQSWQELQSRRALPYPDNVRGVLGQMTAAAVLLHSHLKWQGSLVLQIQGAEQKGTSPVKLAVAEVRSNGAFRATAKIVHTVQGHESLAELVNHDGGARCAITLDPDNKQQGQQAYQGIVPLLNEAGQPLATMADVLGSYMRQSEQLETQFVLAANQAVAVGILIQRMPQEGARNAASLNTQPHEMPEDDYRRIALLTASLQASELLDLGIEEVLHRLFWNEPLARLSAPSVTTPHFACSCSRERVAQTIARLGQTEAEKRLEDEQGIVVDCDFCGARYHFDPVDTALLFVPQSQQYAAGAAGQPVLH